MTNKELQKAIKEATDDVRNLSSSLPSGPFPQHEVTRREMILLRQLTLFKIGDAKKIHEKRPGALQYRNLRSNNSLREVV